MDTLGKSSPREEFLQVVLQDVNTVFQLHEYARISSYYFLITLVKQCIHGLPEGQWKQAKTTKPCSGMVADTATNLIRILY